MVYTVLVVVLLVSYAGIGIASLFSKGANMDGTMDFGDKRMAISDDPSDYFVIRDHATILYGSDNERSRVLEQLRRLWHVAFGLDVRNWRLVSLKLFVWKEARSNVSDHKSSISYVVTGRRTPNMTVDETTVRQKFVEALSSSRIHGIWLSTSNPPVHHVTAFCDSVWMTYKNSSARDALLLQLRDFWITTMAKWKVSKVQLFPLQTVPGTPNDLDRDPVKVIFALVAESLAGIKVDEAKLKIRQVLADAHLPALFGTPFQWTSDSISSSTTDGMSLNFVESFTITYYTIIGFATIEERNTAVEVMRKLWAFILHVPITVVNIYTKNDTQLPCGGPLINSFMVHNLTITVETQFRMKAMDTNEVKQRFQRLLEASSRSFNSDVPLGIENMAMSQQGNCNASPESIWLTAFLFDVYPVVTNRSDIEWTFLPYSLLIYDKIIVSNISRTDPEEVYLAVLQELWEQTLGDGVAEVLIAVSYRRFINQTTLNISYTVLFLTEQHVVDTAATKHLFDENLKNRTAYGIVLEKPAEPTPENVFDVVQANSKVYSLFDTVNLAYETDKVPDIGKEALRNVWHSLLGSAASGVLLTIYRTIPAESFSLAGDNGLPIVKLFFRVTFFSDVSSWNTTALKVGFRKLIPTVRNKSLLLSETELFPIPSDSAKVTASPLDVNSTLSTSGNSSSGAVIRDIVIFSYSNETDRNRILSELRKLWANSLGNLMETQRFAPSDQIVTTEQAVFDVRLTVTSDVILPANSSLVSEANTTIVHKVTFTVVPPTNSMNVSAAKIRFWTAIQNSTIFTHVDDILDDMYNQEYIVPADLSSIVRSALSVATSNRSCSNDKNSSSSAFCGNETESTTPQPNAQLAATLKYNASLVDRINLQYTEDDEQSSSLREISKLWAVSLGLPFSSVDVRLINKTLLGKTQDSQISEIYYAVDYSYGPDMKPPDPSQAVQKFQGFLNGSYGTFVITNGTLPVKPSKLRVASSSTTALPVEEPVIVETSTISDHTGMKPFSYIIYDYLRLMYDSKKQHDEAMAACQTVWSAVLGSDVLFVRLVAYEEYPPFSNDTGSTGQLRTVYYIVIVLSKVPNRDFTNEQAAFRQMVLNGTLPYVINFDEVYPIPEPDAKNAFLIVEAMDPSTFPGLVSGSEVPDAIIRLYQLAIGIDARMVLAWTYHDSSKISGKILVKPYMLVLVVSNNTNLNSTLAQSKFHNLLLHISMASLQAPTQPPNLPPFTENNYLNISDGLPVVVFRDSIRLATPTGHNVSKTLGILQNAWQDVLGAHLTNVTTSAMETSLREREPGMQSSAFSYVIQGYLRPSIIDLRSEKDHFVNETEINGLLYKVTTTMATTTLQRNNVLFP